MGPADSQVTNYKYDSLNRLVGVTNPNGEVITYAYDATGNRMAMTSSKAGENAVRVQRIGPVNPIGRAQGQSLRYDANGNLVERADKNHTRRPAIRGITRTGWSA